MSGPKVVRIVTREEIEAICRGHIRDVEAAVEAVARIAQRLDRLDGAVQEELTRQKQAMALLFQTENWMEIQKRGPVTVASLQAYADQIRAEVIAAAAAERAKGRRLAEAARTLVAALEKVGQPVAPQLRGAVQTATAADPAELAVVEAQINEGMRQLAVAGANVAVPSDTMLGLAGRLGTGLAEQSIEAWLARMPPTNPREARLDGALAELKVLADADTLATFERRAREIASQDETQRALLTDSLILEAGRFAAQRRAQEQIAFRLHQARAAVASLLPEDAKVLTARIDAALAKADGREGVALCEEANAIVDREAKVLAAQARREAVLSGLSALGYEIRGGMATAWAKDGRVVVRKPGTQDYGVELGAPGDASRLQVRLVGSDQPASVRSAERDRDQEVSWCSEFEALQAKVTAAGGHVSIERAVGVGVQPVKTMTFADVAPPTEYSEVRPVARTLR
jgi:hypothetical protein